MMKFKGKRITGRKRRVKDPPLPPPPPLPPKPRRYFDVFTIAVYLIHPPISLTTEPPCIISSAINTTPQFCHPITRNILCLPPNFDLSKLHPTNLAVSYQSTGWFHTLLVFPPPKSRNPNFEDFTLLTLSNGGKLRGCLPKTEEWADVWGGRNADDLIIFNENIYVIDSLGKLYVITCTNSEINVGDSVSNICPCSGGWRKRLVVDGQQMYLVTRTAEEYFFVYKRTFLRGVDNWEEIKGFEGEKVLFISKDSYFFCEAGLGFLGREYKDCIVFSEGAFPGYASGCWNFRYDGDIAVFRLGDKMFAKEGENAVFPRINWLPPAWILDVASGSAAEFKFSSPSKSCSLFERGSVEDEALDSNNNGKDGEVPSNFIGQDKEQEGKESDSNGQSQENEKMQCDHEKEDDEMHSNANIEGGASLQEAASPSLFGKDSIPGACTCCTSKRYEGSYVTTKFEGFDVRSDLVPTLQNIWRKHGNIVENSIIRCGDMISRALETLANIVRILEDNSAKSLTGCQVDYLSSALSDLKCLCLKVCWLIPFVEKAVKLHKSKHLLDSLNNLRQSQSQINEERAILFGELAKLDQEENKLKEEMAKLSKMIPFAEKVKFDEPLGLGLI